MSDFSQQVVLVTGASRGIGRQICEEFSALGAKVVLAARSKDVLDDLVQELSRGKGKSWAVAIDISDREQVKKGVSEAIQHFGRIDILVNNAGIARDNLMLRMKETDWDQVLSTNLDGVYNVTREVLPGMVRQHYGRIINVTSVVAQMGNPGQVNYVAAKAGIIGLTKALAREVASRNITVNAVAPGLIDTDMTAGLAEKAAGQHLERIPLKRMGTVEDVAFGVRFLASKEAGYITGHVLNINGGMYM